MTPSMMPQIIQGGMGAGVSGWPLARAVAAKGQLGVVSGTALDAILARRLQVGDLDGSLRRALARFPWPDIAERILERYFVPGGKPQSAPFRASPIPTVPLKRRALELIVAANFVEVWLAKEGHDGPVGINYLEKIQLPTLPSLFGAILAGVHCVLMGAGLPAAIPGIMDQLARWEAVEMRVRVTGDEAAEAPPLRLDPASFADAPPWELDRPFFLPIVSSSVAARTLIRSATGSIDGFVVEGHTAGGHNAPPRRRPEGAADTSAPFGPRDVPNLAKFRAFDRPFWLAGGYASPEGLAAARREGAAGIQVGTVFALSAESGTTAEIKAEIVRRGLARELEVVTDLRASPTGYPFKLVVMPGTMSEAIAAGTRQRVCDLGFLREVYSKGGSEVGYRCPAEPVENYVAKGGTAEGTEGRQCLCNGLVSTIGLGQMRAGKSEPPIVTAGEDFSFLPHVVKGKDNVYTAADAIDYLTGPAAPPTA